MVVRKKSSSTTESSPVVSPASDSDRLLAPKRRGLFRRKSGDGTRSDSDGQVRSMTPFKRWKESSESNPSEGKKERRPLSRALTPFKKRFASKSVDAMDPETPPVTPDKLSDDEALQVQVVTVKATTSNKDHAVEGEHNDEISAMSDLTDNRTYKRLTSFNRRLEDREAVKAAMEVTSNDISVNREEEKSVPLVKARMEMVQASQAGGSMGTSSADKVQANETNDTPVNEEAEAAGQNCTGTVDPVTYFLKYMDQACTSDAGGTTPTRPSVNKTYSFVPEWGVAPSKDDRDKQVKYQELEANPEKATSEKKGPSKEELHENFEMVLEDLQSSEEQLAQKRHRSWLKTIARRNADVEIHAAGQTFEHGISPLTVEEEKKEEDFVEVEPVRGAGGARKMGKKLIKSFRRNKKSKGDLPPVSEDGEFEARVPKTNKTLGESDLLGEQVVQDIYRDLDATISSEEAAKSKQSSEEAFTTIENVEGEGDGGNMLSSFMSMLTGGSKLPAEVQEIPEQGGIPKSQSWIEQIRRTITEDSGDEKEISPAEKQAALAYVQNSTIDNPPPPRRPKPVWREAKDPKSGRSYYYHRKTREVTWKKPQELIDYEERLEKGTWEDLRILSVASDGDLAAAAERTGDVDAEGAMRKKDPRDFDPVVWSTKEKIVKLLETMDPPDGSSVDEILKKYEGREELLLKQLKEIKAGRPFDEPVASEKAAEDEALENGNSTPRMRLPSLGRVRSGLGKNATPSKKTTPSKTSENTPKASSVDAKASTPRGMDPPSQGKEVTLNDARPEERKVIAPTPTRNATRAARARLSAKRAANAAKLQKALAASSSGSNLETVSESFDTQEPPQIKNTAKTANEDEVSTFNKSEASAAPSLDVPKSPGSMSSRIRTYGSGVASRVSEKTEVVKNTAKGRSMLNPVGENRTVASDATSLSSRGMEPKVHVSTPSPSAPIPGKIVAPRTRELMVEEFSTTDRSYRAEVYDKKRTVRAGRFGATGLRRRPFTSPFTSTPAPYDDSTRGSDSVSALSMDDSKRFLDTSGYMGSKTKDVNDARRRALDDAIAREDWDLAAALSDAMRSIKTKPVNEQQPPAEWKQSELDRFISQNDWDAVASYIANVRVAEAKNKASSKKKSSRRRPQAELLDEDDNLKKRYGSRSQLQRGEMDSDSSWDSEDSSYSSDTYSSTSSYSEPRRRYRYASKHSLPVKSKKGRPKEFAC